MENCYDVSVVIDEKISLENIYITLKSDDIISFNLSEIEDIIKENGIVFKNNEEWIGTKKSFICLSCEDRENMIIVKDLLNKYGNLIIHTYKKNNNYILFAINRNLLSSYYELIKKFMIENYEMEQVNIYISISNYYEKTEITNVLSENDIKYLLINNSIALDLEIVLPEDITNIIYKMKNKEELNKIEIELKIKFKDVFFNLLPNTNIKINLMNSESTIDLEELIELLNM